MRWGIKIVLLRFSLLLFAFMVSNCSTLPLSPRPSDLGISLAIPPAFIEVTSQGSRAYDSLSLLKEGNARYAEGRWEEALTIYNQLILHAPPETEEHRAALFNAGLTYLRLDETEKAQQSFQALIRLDPRHPLSLRAFRNLLDLAEAKEDWQEAQAILKRMDELSARPLSPFEALVHEAMVRSALHPAEVTPQDLEGLTLEFRSRVRKGEELSRSLYARLTYSLGGAYLYQARALTLDPDLPVSTLHDLMESKAQHLLKAQDAYMQSIRALDPFWATASAFRIGNLYESFYKELRDLQPPRDLTLPEERESYQSEIERLLEPLRQKAMLAYEELIRFSQRYSYATPWISRAEEHLQKLRGRAKPQG